MSHSMLICHYCEYFALQASCLVHITSQESCATPVTSWPAVAAASSDDDGGSSNMAAVIALAVLCALLFVVVVVLIVFIIRK